MVPRDFVVVGMRVAKGLGRGDGGDEDQRMQYVDL
jgi:hypothetical protein